jgi:hypothetical protein
MQDSDAERFEAYLKQFRPRAAESLPMAARRRVARLWFTLPAFAVAAMVILVLVVLAVRRHQQSSPVPRSVASSAGVQRLRKRAPLTIRDANDLLAHAPSFQEALDELAFESENAPAPRGRKSALGALSEELNKL